MSIGGRVGWVCRFLGLGESVWWVCILVGGDGVGMGMWGFVDGVYGVEAMGGWDEDMLYDVLYVFEIPRTPPVPSDEHRSYSTILRFMHSTRGC